MPLIQPKLIPGVQYQLAGASLSFVNGGHTFALDLDSVALAEAVQQVLDDLSTGTASAAELARRHDAALKPYDTPTLLGILSGENILTEARPADGMRDGSALFYELRAHHRAAIAPTLAHEPGALKYSRGELSHDDLKAWSIEYYFTTRFAEQCIVAAASQHANPPLQRLFEEFFIEEVGHDKLLERSLLGFGFSAADLETLTPHISTVAAMGMLLRASLFDLPLFVTLVGQLEGTEAQCRRYIALLEQSGLPHEAIHPQIVHEMINIEHGHFDEALDMAAALGSVDAADIERCQRLLALYAEMRKAVYPWVFAGTAAARPLDAASYLAAWRAHGPAIKKSLLSIACANAPEILSRSLARDFVELRKVPYVAWSPTADRHVAAAMLEYSLWKVAYQEPERIAGTLAWLDALADGRTADDGFVPRFLRVALQAADEVQVPA